MKVRIQEDPRQQESEVVIHCRNADDDEIKRTLNLLSQLNSQIIGKKNNISIPVKITDVLYFDSVDKQTFLYTESDVMETPLRLYMLEERLSNSSFFRTSKSTIINLNKISSLKPEFGGRMEATLINGERLMISRQYLPELKIKLEM